MTIGQRLGSPLLVVFAPLWTVMKGRLSITYVRWIDYCPTAEDAESDVNGEEMEGFAAQLKEEKEMALNESMEKLMVGISDARVGIIMAMQYALLSIYTSLDLKAVDLVE